MKSKANQHEGNNQRHILPFHQRFNIEVELEAAKQRFISRLFNLIDGDFLGFTRKQCHLSEYVLAFKYVAFKLGIRYDGNNTLEYYAGSEFLQVLRTIEALFKAFQLENYANSADRLDKIVELAISESEIDLGISWRGGLFYPSGAKLMDEELVNEPLRWLADPKYNNVLAPFKKGLTHYLEANKNPEKLADTITDIYEALEAMAKFVTGRDKDLSANRELFVSKLRLGRQYGKMLIDYIDYANDYRHGTEPSKTRANPNPNEVEAFIYTTGLFIRLAVKQLEGGG